MGGISRVLAMLAVGMALLAAGLWTPNPPVQAAGATVKIPGDYYVPAAIVIEAGQTVTWYNGDSDLHTAVNVAGAPEPFLLPTYPGQYNSFKFTKPGVYPYYCREHTVYDPKLHRVAAHKDVNVYPVAMEGLIVVRGPGFTGAPAATVNITGGNFAPYFVVVQAGGKVTWANNDTEASAVVVQGGEEAKLDLPVGKSQTATFSKPGIYLFYDELHATFDKKTGQAAAKKGTKTFPVSMQGYVIVL